MKSEKLNQIPNHLPCSLDRPAWTQDDLWASRHLHWRRIRQKHFVGTRGFSTIKDLKLFENGGF